MNNIYMIVDDLYKYNKINDFVNDFKKEIIHFPVKRIYKSIDDIHNMMNNLKKYNIYENDRLKYVEPYTISKLNLKENELKFRNKHTIIINKNDDYDKFEILSDMFLEDLRVNCKIINTKLTSYNYFFKNYKYIGFSLLKKNNKITPHLIREFLWNNVVECTSFKPNVLIAIKQILYPNNSNNNFEMLDPSAGWGDRLIGAIAMNIKYTGIDPSMQLHPRYKNIIDFFCDKKENYKMICSPFENLKLNKEYDFIFTSPPYFDLEIYSSEESQSVNSATSNEENWFNLFFKKYLNNAWYYLKKKCFMAININQKHKGEKYIEWMINYVNSFDDSEYQGIISYIGETSNKPQPIFIWIKK
jgi:hypothetical protein